MYNVKCICAHAALPYGTCHYTSPTLQARLTAAPAAINRPCSILTFSLTVFCSATFSSRWSALTRAESLSPFMATIFFLMESSVLAAILSVSARARGRKENDDDDGDDDDNGGTQRGAQLSCEEGLRQLLLLRPRERRYRSGRP